MKLLDAVSVTVAPGPIDARIRVVASRQRGRIARRQLLAAGVDSAAIARRIASGGLIPVHRAVFAVGHAAPSELTAETSALLAMRDGAALSHASAARRWGVPVPRAVAAGSVIDVVVPGSPGGHVDGVRSHRSRILTTADVRYRDGLPVTSPARTLLDLAPLLTVRGLERALAHVLRTTGTTARDVERLLARSGRHLGRGSLTALLAYAATAGFTRSEAEELFLSLVDAAGLPRPLANVRRGGYELDFLWAAAGLAVEIDGFAVHRDSFEADRAKDVALERHRITVVRFTWRQLTEEPLAVMVSVGQLLAARGITAGN